MRIKDYFGGIGNIYISSKDSKFMVRSLDEVLKIITHFDNYPRPGVGLASPATFSRRRLKFNNLTLASPARLALLPSDPTDPKAGGPTQKKADYVLFRRVVEIMQKKGILLLRVYKK